MTPVSPRPMRLISATGGPEEMVFEFAKRHLGDGSERLKVDGIVDAHDAVDVTAVVGERTVVEVLER
ncbi:MAG: hypothetical protein U0793_15220 [Gemmataceae bacterium]